MGEPKPKRCPQCGAAVTPSTSRCACGGHLDGTVASAQFKQPHGHGHRQRKPRGLCDHALMREHRQIESSQGWESHLRRACALALALIWLAPACKEGQPEPRKKTAAAADIQRFDSAPVEDVRPLKDALDKVFTSWAPTETLLAEIVEGKGKGASLFRGLPELAAQREELARARTRIAAIRAHADAGRLREAATEAALGYAGALARGMEVNRKTHALLAQAKRDALKTRIRTAQALIAKSQRYHRVDNVLVAVVAAFKGVLLVVSKHGPPAVQIAVFERLAEEHGKTTLERGSFEALMQQQLKEASKAARPRMEALLRDRKIEFGTSGDAPR